MKECYIIRPSIDIKELFYNTDHGLYIATSRYLSHYSPGTTVHIYGNASGKEGIIAEGLMLDFPIMSKYVQLAYQKNLYAREFRQLPLHLTRVSPDIYFEKKHLFQLPSMNMYGRTDLANPDYLYSVHDMDFQINFIKHKYYQYIGHDYNTIITDGHYRLWFHQLRENVIKLVFKDMLTGKNSCSLCKMKYAPLAVLRNDFFELHEKIEIDFSEKYRRISRGNFRIVCPNCHKKEHEKIMNSTSKLAD